MKKHTVFSVLAAGAFLIAPTASIYAETNQEKLNTIESQLDGATQQIETKQQEKQQIEQEITALQQKIDSLNTEITKTGEELATIEQEITKIEQQIEEKQQHIAYLQAQIEKREAVIKSRLQALQEQPRNTLITELLINANNIADLLENMYSVSLILNSDNTILEEQERDKQAVEAEQKAVKEKETQLQEQKATQLLKQQQFAADKEQQEVLMNEMTVKLSQTMEEIESTEEAKAILESQKEATQQLIEQEKLAAEQAAKEAAAKATATSSSAASTQAAINPGGFIKPSAGSYTSSFGQRWGKLHAGIDIAGTGAIPVVAAAAGVVIRAYTSESYGNVVFISHRIKGQTYTTVYAHLSSFSVSAGQAIQQGQQLGIMGNTGHSTGQHLHFELHVGEWNQSKSNAVDPMPYLY